MNCRFDKLLFDELSFDELSFDKLSFDKLSRHGVGLSWLTECLTGKFWLTVRVAGTKPLKPGPSRLKRDVWYA